MATPAQPPLCLAERKCWQLCGLDSLSPPLASPDSCRWKCSTLTAPLVSHFLLSFAFKVFCESTKTGSSPFWQASKETWLNLNDSYTVGKYCFDKTFNLVSSVRCSKKQTDKSLRGERMIWPESSYSYNKAIPSPLKALGVCFSSSHWRRQVSGTAGESACWCCTLSPCRPAKPHQKRFIPQWLTMITLHLQTGWKKQTRNTRLENVPSTRPSVVQQQLCNVASLTLCGAKALLQQEAIESFGGRRKNTVGATLRRVERWSNIVHMVKPFKRHQESENPLGS